MPNFEPDYRHILNAALNKRPARMPIYEHKVSPVIMGRVLGDDFEDLINGNDFDRREYFRKYCDFYKRMTYDTVSFEANITWILPDGGALRGGKAGPIQDRNDFNTYPWDELPNRYWNVASPQLNALIQCVPQGMKLIGGVGNGVFEISEDLVGLEYLAYMQYDDPELFKDLYAKIGDLMVTIWEAFLERYGNHFVVCRFGDDLGFKTGLMVDPRVIRDHIFPEYRRVIAIIRKVGTPFLWHSCGNIFEIMDDAISLGINAKHSNEDTIAEFDHWIERYSDRIGLFGGIDVDVLCQQEPSDIVNTVVAKAQRYRKKANGYALGSGNSIADYVPVEGYLAMIEAAQKIREVESKAGAPAFN